MAMQQVWLCIQAQSSVSPSLPSHHLDGKRSKTADVALGRTQNLENNSLPRFGVLNTLTPCISPPTSTPVSEHNLCEAQPNAMRKELVNLEGA